MRYKEVDIYENDVSAEEETEIQSAWIQSKDEDSRRKKSACKQKSKRKKSIISVGRIYVAFSSIKIGRCVNEVFRVIEEEPGFPECLWKREILCEQVSGNVCIRE